MAISVSVLAASEDDIRRYREAPDELDAWLNGIIPYHGDDECYLAEYWAVLHYLLTGEDAGGELPLAVLRRGDVTYDVDDPTHAITGATTRELANALKGLSETDLQGATTRKS